MTPEEPVSVAVHEITDHERQQPYQTKKPPSNILSGWLVEILGIFGAVASFIAVLGALIALNHHTVSHLPFKVKLTTVISILAKATEACLGLVVAACLSQIMWMRYSSRARPLKEFAVYDAATRGAKGQALFLFQRGQSAKGYAGVVIALLILAVGPFYQQTVNYEILNGSAMLGRCFETNYTQSSGAMDDAIHGGLFTDLSQTGTRYDQNLQILNNNCSTGECHWPVFASLGICSACENIIDQFTQDCQLVLDPIDGITVGCNTSLSNGAFITNYTDPEVGQVLISMAANNGSKLGDLYGNAVIYDWSTLIYTAPTVIQAESCVLYYCVRGYNSNVSESILLENFTASWSDPYAAWVNPEPLLWPGAQQPTVPYEGEHVVILSPPKSEWARLNLTKATNFTVDWYTDNIIKQDLIGAFTGTQYINYTTNDSSSKYLNTTSADFVVTQVHNYLFGKTDQNMTTIMNDLSLRMTNSLRNTCLPSRFSQGTMMNVAILLDVDWLWLIFVGVVIVFTAVYLVATMFESTRRKSVLWKTGIWPLLFHGLGGTESQPASTPDATAGASTMLTAADMAKLDNLAVLRKRAEGVQIRLERNESGTWFLSKS